MIMDFSNKYKTEYKSIKEILNDPTIDYNFRPENVTFLGELQKSMLIELLITNMRPYINVFFYLTSSGKYIPFVGFNELKALIDFINNEYELFRIESLPELTGKKFNQIPYVMRADLEKHIVKCFFFENLSIEELQFVQHNAVELGFNP